jgi:hypothetical protein
MVYTHVPFERQFASPSEEASRNYEYMALFGSQESGTLRWNELLQCKCVVILGEGKCGKTHEFKTQHQKLREGGKFSFFVPLELLHDGDFLDTVTEEEEHEFELWLENSDSEAVFFLDAVDELKLRKGTLRKALRKIKEAMKSQAHRARFFISCRPNDWFEELDLGIVSGLVPPIKLKAQTTDSPDGEEVFSTVISRKKFSERQQGVDNGDIEQAVKVLSLLPLTRKETIEFAKLYAPNHAQALETHLEDKELWHLYQLPADIISALEQLESDGLLGNLEEQLAFGISQKIREVSAKKRNSLSERQAMEGAQRIALSLFLMKRRSIYLQTSGVDTEGIGAADILEDWSLDMQIELLGKSLFDPIGVGAFRFHHRSTQEFLAAQRLKKLRASGLSTSDLFNLFFADIGDEKVIVPSMEPVVAWMALWYQDILSKVKNRNPLLLFRQGLPALLSLEVRSELIAIFVRRFAGSEWRRIGVGHQELKRVTTSELAPVVRKLWEQAYTGYETRELLLELIYLTPMSGCSDLAFQAAFDQSLPSNHRTYAALAVLKCGTIEQVGQLGKNIVAGGWPEQLVRSILPELLPEAINLEGFIELSHSLQEIPGSLHGLGYALLKSVKSDAVPKAQKVIIRNNFTQAVWENRLADGCVHRANSLFDHFVDSVIAACFETVPTEPEEIDNWAWSLAVAFHFGERQTSIIARDETKKLQQLLSTEVELRKAFFWACFDITEALEAPESDWHRFVSSDYGWLLRPFTHNDFSWLLQALSPAAAEERRGVAFYTLSQFVRDGNEPEILKQISELVSDRVDLFEELEKVINPPPRESDKYEVKIIKLQEERAVKETKRMSGWQSWRKKVMDDENFQLDDEHCDNTLYNLYEAIKNTDSGNTWGHWNSGFVETAFSKDFLKKVREKLSDYWKSSVIQLFSERPEGSRNSFQINTLMALFATKCCAENGDWAIGLDKNDAIQATRISTLELNGFASFITQLEALHPSVVIEVIIRELQHQLDTLLNIGEAPILRDIFYHGTQLMKVHAAVNVTSNLPIVMQAIRIGNNSESKYALELVATHGTDETVDETLAVLKTLINDSEKLELTVRNYCVYAIAKLDLSSACDYVLKLSNDLSSQDMREQAIALFAVTFGEHHRDGKLSFDCIEPTRRLEQLKKLVIRAYQAIKPIEDEEHTGCYTPNTRDHAEHARSFLLECIATTNSPKTLSVLYELSSLPEFAHLSDRLKQMATELAARISEPEAMNASNFRKFDQELQYLPYDTSSLFSVMNNRLADFEHHLINDEQSIVDTLRKVDGETELRRFISYWMNQNSRGAYTITQEAVVVSEKRTDIRLHVSSLDRYASIELKLDDTRNKWSGTQLRVALEEQLVGRYLNHERSYVGCLLIGMRESRKWEHPDTGKRMDLKETVNWLQGIADEIMEGRPELRVSVKGIDYSTTANG